MSVNRQRIATAIAESPFDVVIARSPENFYYTAGTRVVTQIVLDNRPAMTVWPREGPPHLLVCSTETFQIRQQSWITRLREYRYRESHVAQLVALLEELGASHGTIGLEKKIWCLEDWEELRRALPFAQFVDCGKMFATLRMVKAPEEIQRLRQASVAADRAILEAFQFAAPGKTERQVADVLQHSLIEQGAETVPFLVVATGSRSGLAHPHPGLPTDRVLQTGDLVRVDVGGNFGFYWSDNMRTGVVGKATHAQRDHWRRAWDVQQAVIEAVKPGITADELFKVGRKAYTRLGVISSIGLPGHGIGLSMHEEPVIEAENLQELLPGMVLCIETAIWPSEKEAYDTEDQVLVIDEGFELLSRTYDWQEFFVSTS